MSHGVIDGKNELRHIKQKLPSLTGENVWG